MKTFQALDKNGDGVLSREELILGYSKNMGEQEAIDEVNRIMVEIDKNNSGEIDYSGTLLLYIKHKNLLPHQSIGLNYYHSRNQRQHSRQQIQ